MRQKNISDINLEEKYGVGYSITPKFEHISLPSTKEKFEYDEYLEISTSEKLFKIQIEHSENLDTHKSNLVEFLLRNRTVFRDDKDALAHQAELLTLFGYRREGRYFIVKKAGKDTTTAVPTDSSSLIHIR